ncbi:hypothetical protein [Streptomyces californicus]
MPDTSPTPADQLRAAAVLLREAAGHATPGPWRTHDTHLGGVGGHTATVLTDRPNLNDTELIAWLPTMSHEPWDEARNSWRNAGWMALMHPGVGLALAAWLERAAEHVMTYGPGGTFADPHALAVARQLLGTTGGEGAAAAPEPDTELRDRIAAAIWARYPDAEPSRDGLVMGNPHGLADAALTVLAAPPAPADRAAVLREAAEAVLAHPGPHRDEHQPDAPGFWWDTRDRDAAADIVRRLAGEAAAGAHQTTEGEARPAEHSWAAELHDPLANEWVPGTRYVVRDRAVNALEHGRKVAATWKDGTPTERRLVRATTTYTVEPTPAVPAAPEEQGR